MIVKRFVKRWTKSIESLNGLKANLSNRLAIDRFLKNRLISNRLKNRWGGGAVGLCKKARGKTTRKTRWKLDVSIGCDRFPAPALIIYIVKLIS